MQARAGDPGKHLGLHGIPKHNRRREMDHNTQAWQCLGALAQINFQATGSDKVSCGLLTLSHVALTRGATPPPTASAKALVTEKWGPSGLQAADIFEAGEGPLILKTYQ